MNVPQINFAHNRSTRSTFGIIVLVVAVVVLTALVSRQILLNKELAALVALSSATGSSSRTSPPTEIAGEIQKARSVRDHLDLPWGELLRAVESTVGSDVVLLTFDPDTSQQVLTVSGEAKDFSALMGYVNRVTREPRFQRVKLSNHEVQTKHPQKPVRFTMEVGWSDDRLRNHVSTPSSN